MLIARWKLLILQALVAVVALLFWHVGSAGTFGVAFLPKFFFSAPLDVGGRIRREDRIAPNDQCPGIGDVAGRGRGGQVARDGDCPQVQGVCVHQGHIGPVGHAHRARLHR